MGSATMEGTNTGESVAPGDGTDDAPTTTVAAESSSTSGGPPATSTAGTSEGTTTAGGGAFQPCPAEEPCKILPLGDSITFGLGFDGGYRVELFRLALADGHEITFTGTQPPNGPSMVDGAPFPRNHEGISGETIEQIAARVPSPALNTPPHIILLHAGTNDMVRSPDEAPMRLGALLDELIEQAPDALLVVSNIIPLSFGGDSVGAYNAAIEPLVAARAQAGAHIVFADQFSGFPTGELGDGVHPNEAGYARMAGVWYEVIEPYLR